MPTNVATSIHRSPSSTYMKKKRRPSGVSTKQYQYNNQKMFQHVEGSTTVAYKSDKNKSSEQETTFVSKKENKLFDWILINRTNSSQDNNDEFRCEEEDKKGAKTSSNNTDLLFIDSWMFCCCRADSILSPIAPQQQQHFHDEEQSHLEDEERRDSPATFEENDAITRLPFSEQMHEYINSFPSDKIHISYLNTYQGRISTSSNGCTVIASLVVVRHFHYNKPVSLPNYLIEEVIDVQAPILLKEIRAKLGLGRDSLMIPSDVNDYFIDHSLLNSANFVGVCGGNVMNPAHIRSFFELLGEPLLSHQKKAATFYFHEHVISILLYPYYYEVIDSLPTWVDVVSGKELEQPSGLRIRCLDRDALLTTLRWYCCRKFTDENIQFCTECDWNEMDCDLDPRVFQAFVWIQIKS